MSLAETCPMHESSTIGEQLECEDCLEVSENHEQEDSIDAQRYRDFATGRCKDPDFCPSCREIWSTP